MSKRVEARKATLRRIDDVASGAASERGGDGSEHGARRRSGAFDDATERALRRKGSRRREVPRESAPLGTPPVHG